MNISDIVDVLGLDGYVALSDVIVLPVWFKVSMTVLFVGCLIWASISNVRMLVAIGIRRYWLDFLGIPLFHNLYLHIHI